MKRALYLIFLAGIFCLSWWGAGKAYDFVKSLLFTKAAAIPEEYSTVDLGNGITIRIPGKVSHYPFEVPAFASGAFSESRGYRSRAGSKFIVMVNTAKVRAEFPISLEAAAEGALQTMRGNPKTSELEATKRDTSVLGWRAIIIDAAIKTKKGTSISYKGIVCVVDGSYFLISCIAPSSEASLQPTWNSIIESIARGH
jgi:hypothetical protein